MGGHYKASRLRKTTRGVIDLFDLLGEFRLYETNQMDQTDRAYIRRAGYRNSVLMKMKWLFHGLLISLWKDLLCVVRTTESLRSETLSVPGPSVT